MVERAAGLAKDSHARTRHAAVLVKDGSMVAWGTNGVPFPGEDHCYCKYAEFGVHDNCRTHAEQRAIGLARDGDHIGEVECLAKGSRSPPDVDLHFVEADRLQPFERLVGPSDPMIWRT